MANIVFIQRLWHEYPGVESIAAVLKKGGHNVRVIIEGRPKKIIKRLSKGDVAAFSVMTGMHHWALKVAAAIKDDLGLMTVFGGPHPTFFPEFINEKAVDLICRGEGEYAMLELANAVDNSGDLSAIANLWVKKDGKVYKNPLRPLIEDLCSIPFPDRSIYYAPYPFLRHNGHKIFMVARGCPFDCTFCFNEKLKEMYAGLGSYVRFRGPREIIDEIKMIRQRYPLNTVFFNDDMFIFNNQWLHKFLPLYKNEIGLPFYVSARADTITGDIVSLLKEAGCKCVSFAIESGNESLRNRVLGKTLTDQQIVDSAALLRQHGIKFATYNMIGIPGETIENVFETVDINIKIKTDYPRCSFLTPYPGTRIAEFARQAGYLETSVDSISGFSQQNSSIIKMENKNEIINIHSFFQTMILFPALKPLIKTLIKLPANILFKLWWAFVYLIIFTKSEGRRIDKMLCFALRSAGSFSEKQDVTE